jgi:hypothetical protein
MSYSWTRFGIGVALGLVAFALLSVAIAYIYGSILLLFISNVLIAQVPEASSDQNSEGVSSQLIAGPSGAGTS